MSFFSVEFMLGGTTLSPLVEWTRVTPDGQAAFPAEHGEHTLFWCNEKSDDPEELGRAIAKLAFTCARYHPQGLAGHMQNCAPCENRNLCHGPRYQYLIRQN